MSVKSTENSSILPILRKRRNLKTSNFRGFAGYWNPYFISFDDDCGLELMHNDIIPPNKNDVEKQNIGLIHLAISVGSEDGVNSKTEELRTAGYKVTSEPRWTGDGYYESCILDPENNIIEVTI